MSNPHYDKMKEIFGMGQYTTGGGYQTDLTGALSTSSGSVIYVDDPSKFMIVSYPYSITPITPIVEEHDIQNAINGDIVLVRTTDTHEVYLIAKEIK